MGHLATRLGRSSPGPRASEIGCAAYIGLPIKQNGPAGAKSAGEALPLKPHGMSGLRNPPGVSFGSRQRSLPTPQDSHLRQSLNPAVPATPVGPSPGFRAVACVCLVTSPNEVKLDQRLRLLAPPRPAAARTFLNTNGLRVCQEKTA